MALSWSDKQRFCQYMSYLALILICVGIGWSVYFNSISSSSNWAYPPAASTQPISSIGVHHLLLPRYTLSTELELEADHQRLLIQSYMIDRLRMETRRTQRKELSQRYVQQRRQQRKNSGKDAAPTGSNSADDPDDTTAFDFPDDDTLLNSSSPLTDWTALLDSQQQRQKQQSKPAPSPIVEEIFITPVAETPAPADATSPTEPQLTIPKIVVNPQEPTLPVDLSNAVVIEAKPATSPAQLPQSQQLPTPATEEVPAPPPVLDELTIPKIESPSTSTSADATTVVADFVDTDLKSATILLAAPTPLPSDDAPDTPFNFLSLSPEEVTKHPELCYAYRPRLVQTDDGPGVKVKISVNEQCFPDGIPLSYFRVHTTGTGFTAANPPIAIGPHPLSVPFAYTPYVNATYTPYEGPTKKKDAPTPSHTTTSVEVFLLLPDHGAYHLHVRLQLFNMSIDATSRSFWFMFSMKKDELDKLQGEWIDRAVYDTDQLKGITTIPITEGSDVKNFTRIEIPRDWPSPFALEQIYKLPLCGTEIKEKGIESGVSPISGKRYGVGDLSGRWSVSRRTTKGELFDATQFPPHLLITSAIWRPYFCQLDFTFKPSEGLNKMRWIHFIGDSNSRSMFDTLCSSGRGKLAWSPSIDTYMDPPQMCFGPKAMKEGWSMASDHKRILTSDEYAAEERDKYANFDEVIAAEKALNGTDGQWILTFTSWFFGKETIWTPESNYREQCRSWQKVAQNTSNVYPGWPACEMIGDWIDDLAGPGLIWHSWGSHHLEKAYENYAMQEMLFDIYRRPFHMMSHMMFPLSTAENPSLIPKKFGNQFRVRNNERVQLNNILVSHAVRQWTKQGYYGSLTKYRDPFKSVNTYYKAPEPMWLPLLDAFSPTHAAYEVLNYDTVHFEPFFMRFWGRILLHYIKHSPNYGPVPAAKKPAH